MPTPAQPVYVPRAGALDRTGGNVDGPKLDGLPTGDQLATSLAAKAAASALASHAGATDNPHAVTKEQVGLGSVDDTSDAAKPVSVAVQAALDAKQAAAAFDRVLFPHLSCGGLGTEASPWTHADGTAGIQTAVDALAAGRGGKVWLAAGVYSFTSTAGVQVRTPAIVVEGQAGGFSRSPNAETEGLAGTKIKIPSTGVGFRFGSFESAAEGVLRAGHSGLRRVYLVGADRATAPSAGNVGVRIDGNTDQVYVEDVHCFNLAAAVHVRKATGGGGDVYDGIWDAGQIDGGSAIHCGYGLYADADTICYYNQIVRWVVADNTHHGVYLAGGADQRSLTFSACAFVRNATEGVTDGAGLYSAATRTLVTGCQFSDNGTPLLAGPPVAADGIVFAGNNQTAIGNLIEGHDHASSCGIRVKGTAGGCAAALNKYVDNTKHLVVAAGAEDTTIEEPNLPPSTITSGGTRTRSNRVSANVGDPNSAGDWNGVSKPAGLTIRETDSGVLWLYDEAGGRTCLNPGVVRGTSVLASTYTVTGSWASTGLTVSPPRPGTYTISGRARATASGSSFGHVAVRLYDATAGAAVADSETMAAICNSTGAQVIGTSPIGPVPITVAAAATIQLQAFAGAGPSVAEVQSGASDGIGETTLSYVAVSLT